MSICVFLFGGWNASQTDMDRWVASAQAQRSQVRFGAYPWPSGAHWEFDTAVDGFKRTGQFDQALKDIQSSSADTIYIVGHSSGCAIANSVDAALKDTSKIALIVLDGFVPSKAQLNRAGTQVWAAANKGKTSKNHDALKNKVGAKLQVYQSASATSKLALHFAVVNSDATDKIKEISQGYMNCRANLMWL